MVRARETPEPRRTVRFGLGTATGPEAETARVLSEMLAGSAQGMRIVWVHPRGVTRWMEPAATIHFGPHPDRARLVFQALPDPTVLDAYLARHPGALAGVPHPEMADAVRTPGRVRVLPFLLPDAVYDGSHDSAVFRMAVAYHLEARPRIVVVGPHDGRGVTRALQVALALIRPAGGELVMVDSLSHRAALAPLVQRMGLTGQVVFLPPVPSPALWAVLHGADCLLAPSTPRAYPLPVLWAAAAGLPVVALDDPLYRLASGDAALLVQSSREDAWVPAVRAALENGRRRERMMALGRAHAERYRAATAIQAWLEVLAEFGD
jgi:glycosyltransferase involved in cell wall biosynthesis